MLQDIRIAVRRLRRRPGLALLAVATLGLAIGSIVPLFALVSAFFLRPLPFEDPGRLVHLWETNVRLGRLQSRVSLPNYLDWKEQSRSFEDLAIFNYTGEDLTGGTEPERISAGRVSANLVELLGVAPAMGRGFLPGEDAPGAAKVAVLMHGAWQQRFEGAGDVLGTTISIGGETYEIVGVMPPSFVFPLPITEILLPRKIDRVGAARDRRALQVVGRLRDGVTPEQAQAEMDAIARRLAERYPVENTDAGVNIIPLRQALNFAHDMFKVYSSALLLAGLLVLGMTCLNLSTLFLARVLTGRREFAIRIALGASRGRLVRQTFFESLVIALLAGAGGLALGSAAAKGFEMNVPTDLYRVGAIGVDGTVVAATLALSIVTAILFGALPALRAGKAEASTTLKDGGHASSSRDALKMQRGLVVTQMALAVVLLVGTLLGVRSFSALREVDLGFDPDSVATMLVVLPADRYGSAEERTAFHASVTERVEAIPGVRSAATVSLLPLNHEMNALEVHRAAERRSAEAAPTASSLRVTPHYFEVMRIPLLAGESFRGEMGVGSEPVVIVNRRLADRLWPGGNPIGNTVDVEGEDAPRRVIGVAGDTVHWELAGERPLQMYIPSLASPGSYFRIVARHEPAMTGVIGAMRDAIAALDPALAVTETRSLRAVVDEFLMPHGMVVVALTILSIGALLLAVIGVYGIMTFFVSRDRRSIGIRMAVGASRAVVMREVLRRALSLAAWGAAIGIAGALALGTVVGGVLYGVSVRDPIVLASVPLLLAAVATLASVVPAWRASRIDPMETLRVE